MDRSHIMDQLVELGDFDELVEVMTAKMSDVNRREELGSEVLNLVIEYVIRLRSITTTKTTEFAAFLLVLFETDPIPESYDEYAIFLMKAFRAVRGENTEVMFEKISKALDGNALLPLSVFGAMHSKYREWTFRNIVERAEKSFDDGRGIAWTAAFAVCFKSKDRVGKIDGIKEAIVRGMGDESTPVVVRMTLLMGVISRFGDRSASLVGTYYLDLMKTLTVDSEEEELVKGLKLAVPVLEVARAKKIPKLGEEVVLDSIFGHVALFYMPSEKMDRAVLGFCEAVGPDVMKSVLDTYGEPTEETSLFFLFVCAHHQSSKGLRFLLSERPIEEEEFRQKCVTEYVSQNTPSLKWLPRLFEIVKPEDMTCFDETANSKELIYWLAVARFIAVCDSFDKLKHIAALLEQKTHAPLVASPYAQMAFATCASLRAHASGGGRRMRVILDYMHACVVFSKEHRIGQVYDPKSVVMEFEQEELRRAKTEKNGFDVEKSRSAVSKRGFTQATAIKDWCEEDRLNVKYLEFAVGRIKSGDTKYVVLVASLTQDVDKLRICIESIRDDHDLTIFFFSALACCARDLALRQLKGYMEASPKKAKKAVLADDVGVAVIVNITPFVPWTPILHDTLIAAITGCRSILVCDSVIGVCKRLHGQEDLNDILGCLLQQSGLYPVQEFVRTISLVLEKSSDVSEVNMVQLCRVWMQILVDDKLSDPRDFEELLFRCHLKDAKVPYLNEMERAVIVHAGCPPLFRSLKRAIQSKVVSLTGSLLPLFYANFLSDSREVSGFCLAIIRRVHRVETHMIIPSGKPLSYEYNNGINEFMSVFASRLPQEKALAAVTTLLTRFTQCGEESRRSSAVLSFYLASHESNRKLFAADMEKLVPIIEDAVGVVSREEDFQTRLFLFRIYDAMAQENPIELYNQVSMSDNDDFVDLYIRHLATSPSMAGTVTSILSRALFDMARLSHEDVCDPVELSRLLSFLKVHIQFFVTEKAPPDRTASIISGIFTSLSVINTIQSIDAGHGDLLDRDLKGVVVEFFDNTCIDLSHGKGMDVSSSDVLIETLVRFANFAYQVSSDVLDTFVDNVGKLWDTIHAELACFLLAEIQKIVPEGPIHKKAVCSCFTMLKDKVFPDFLIAEILYRMAGAFTNYSFAGCRPEIVQPMLAPALRQIISIMAFSPVLVARLTVLIAVVNACPVATVREHSESIFVVLRLLIEKKLLTIKDPIMLETIMEVSLKVQSPDPFSERVDISYYDIVPLTVNDSAEIRDLAWGIITSSLLGGVPERDNHVLCFSTLMSISVKIEEGDTNQYVLLACQIAKLVEKNENATRDMLRVASDIMEPVMSVGNAYCNVAVSQFLRTLSKQCKSPNSEVAAESMLTMARFAARKQCGARVG